MPGYTEGLDFRRSREKMLRDQIEARGIRDRAVIEAMLQLPRHLFVEEALAVQSYSDHPLPIGFGQTISQPYFVALMSELLETSPGMRVLEIGTGSGYQAAVLGKMKLKVFTVERIRELYLAARERLRRMSFINIRLKLCDGTTGWPDEAPFDRIIVTAGAPEVPQPLLEQLADPGIMVIPVGNLRQQQELMVIRKNSGRVVNIRTSGRTDGTGPKVDWGVPGLVRSHQGPVCFVDLVGEHGWKDEDQKNNSLSKHGYSKQTL